MNVEVSAGELVDKYSVLCLKMEYIQDNKKQLRISCEKSILEQQVGVMIKTWPMYYELLHYVNRVIWHKTNDMKAMGHPQQDYKQFALVAWDIFRYNDKRFRLKRIFNMASIIQEQKSYEPRVLMVNVPSREVLSVDRMIYLISLTLDYDVLNIETSDPNVNVILSKYIPDCCLSVHVVASTAATSLADLADLPTTDPELFDIIKVFDIMTDFTHQRREMF